MQLSETNKTKKKSLNKARKTSINKLHRSVATCKKDNIWEKEMELGWVLVQEEVWNMDSLELQQNPSFLDNGAASSVIFDSYFK